jgi:hypothetical protein
MPDASFDRTSSPFTFSQVPHGLWTCGLSAGATRLLGWLWSHDPDFLRRAVTMRYAQKQLGGRVRDQIGELAAAGFLTTTTEAGKGATIVLDGDAWGALGTIEARTSVRGSANIGARSPRTSVRGTAHIGAHIEEQVEEQGADQGEPAADATVDVITARTIADGYWLWVKSRTGKPPVGIGYMALVKIVEVVMKAYDAGAIKRALASMYDDGKPITRQVVEQYLDGRARRNGRRPDAVAAVNAMTFDDDGNVVG